MAFDAPTSNFFPHLRRYLTENPGEFDNLELDCNICFRQIRTTLSSYCSPSEEDAEYCYGAYAVLMCGHFFGVSCLGKWAASRFEAARIQTLDMYCPACRQGSSCPRKNVPYCVVTIEQALSAPKCLSEGGLPPKEIS